MNSLVISMDVSRHEFTIRGNEQQQIFVVPTEKMTGLLFEAGRVK
jgi:hypothetical protein